SALYLSVSCPALAIALATASADVRDGSKPRCSCLVFRSQLAVWTPFTAFAVFSIRSLHISHNPCTISITCFPPVSDDCMVCPSCPAVGALPDEALFAGLLPLIV